ncbi:hypothetical protein GQ457_02G031500 [Hibiscus cannabinus]
MTSQDPAYRYPMNWYRYPCLNIKKNQFLYRSTDTLNPGIDTPIPETILGTDTAPEYRYPGTGIDTCRRGFDTSSEIQPPTVSFGYRYSTSSTDTLGSRIAEKGC